MAYRISLFVVALASAACQQLPDTSDDDDGGGPVSAGSTGTDGSTFVVFDTGTEETGQSGNDEIGELDCDPVAQTGCGPGEKCAAQKAGSSTVYVCVAESGMFDPFGSCTPMLTSGDDGCPGGYACLGSPESGACVPLCLLDSDCTGGVCVPDPYEFVQHCASDCSPFEPGCPAPTQCRRNENRYACLFARDEDVGVDGDPCVLNGDAGCTAGYSCLPGGLVPGCAEANCCTPLCDLMAPDTCASPTTCNPAIESPAPGFEDIGACFVAS